MLAGNTPLIYLIIWESYGRWDIDIVPLTYNKHSTNFYQVSPTHTKYVPRLNYCKIVDSIRK